MEFKEYVKGQRSHMRTPLPPFISMLLLHKRLGDYGFNIPFEMLMKLNVKEVNRLIIFMNNIDPSDISSEALFYNVSIATAMGTPDVNIKKF